MHKSVIRGALSVFLLVSPGLLIGSIPALADERNDNLDVIVLVDESSSLSPLDVKAEQGALRSMIQIPILRNRNIRLGVLPFSSGEQSPRLLDSCALTNMDSAGQKAFYENCPRLISRQLEDNSDDTDFAAAINAALTIFEESTVNNNRIPVILLLTDGKYDPDGDLSTSPEEQNLLDGALAKAKELNASVWPIGFGDADGLALIAMSLAGATLPENCPSHPSAAIAASTDLGLQMTNILSSVICVSPPTPPEATPAKHLVHPMMDTLAVSVKVASSDDPILTDPDGNVVCEGTWDKLGEYSSCLISLDGDTAGEWSLIASDGSQVTWQESGELKVTLDSCDSPGSNPTILVRRADNKLIDWTGSSNWPRADVMQFTRSGEKLISTIVDLDQETIQVPIVDETNELKVTLADAEDTVRGLSVSMGASCFIASPPSTSSSTSVVPKPTKTTIPTPASVPSSEDSQSTTPIWMYLTPLILIAVVLIAVKFSRSKRFPKGSILFQESSVKAGSYIEIDGEIGGQRRISLTRSSGGFVAIESYSKNSEYTLTRKKDMVELRHRKVLESERDNDVDNPETDIEIYTEPFGSSIRVDGFTIKVDLPEDFDEIEFDV